MGAISLRGIDEGLAEALKKAAEKENKSVNQWVLELVRERLGFAKEQRFTKTYDDLDDLFGRWSEEAFLEISNKISNERTIDEALWK